MLSEIFCNVFIVVQIFFAGQAEFSYCVWFCHPIIFAGQANVFLSATYVDAWYAPVMI
jgi:hypothetical protein